MTAIFKADNKSTKAMTNSGFSVDKFRLEEEKAIPFDYKKEYKELYIPKNKPSIVMIPSMNYIAVRGHGDPNVEDGEYRRSIGLLYGIAFTIKMSTYYSQEHIPSHKKIQASYLKLGLYL